MNECKKCKWYDKLKESKGIKSLWKYEEVCCNPKVKYIFIPKEKACEKWEVK